VKGIGNFPFLKKRIILRFGISLRIRQKFFAFSNLFKIINIKNPNGYKQKRRAGKGT
jgi:hypothetical protein